MYIAIIITTVIAKVVSCTIVCTLFYFVCGGDVTVEGQKHSSRQLRKQRMRQGVGRLCCAALPTHTYPMICQIVMESMKA
ncbi:hypothetical protein F4803DRAFT_509359 [Xylaria telfairii]|nr:hypothetical protein F4803DRAFT_509359 [Xylaria telfairii]